MFTDDVDACEGLLHSVAVHGFVDEVTCVEIEPACCESQPFSRLLLQAELLEGAKLNCPVSDFHCTLSSADGADKTEVERSWSSN